MSKLHKVKCDYCNLTAELEWNGEHWLAPTGWFEFWDDRTARLLDTHACPKCAPKSKLKKVKMKLPKDLEAKRDDSVNTSQLLSDYPYDPGSVAKGFNLGAQAVLEHEMIKKLEEGIAHIERAYPLSRDRMAHQDFAKKLLAEFRAWKDGK